MVQFNMKGHVQPILLYSLDLMLTLKDVGSSFLLFVLCCMSRLTPDLFLFMLILEVYLALLLLHCPLCSTCLYIDLDLY